MTRVSVTGLLLLNAVLYAQTAGAQGVVTPTSHWGAVMLPEVLPRTEYGIHFVGFTQYGKELIPGTQRYSFEPYNDIDETLGFNFLTYSQSDIFSRITAADNALSYRTTYMAGLVSDWATQRLQNRVVHWANWRGENRLDRVPRRTTDTPNTTSDGPTKWMQPIVGVSQEYFLRLQNIRRRRGREEMVATPLFVGGGFAFSSINQELFLHAGTDVAEINLRPGGGVTGLTIGIPGLIRIGSIGAGGMVRSGVLLPGVHFDDLTASYLNLQGVFRVGLDIHEHPVQVDLALTSGEGFFVARRTPEQWAIIREVNEDPGDVYASKSPMRERFAALRVRAGSFTFETYNDTMGGKDKGPSFGAHLTFSGEILSSFQ